MSNTESEAPRYRRADLTERPCPACGAQVQRQARFCPGCGAYLNPPEDRRSRRQKQEGRWQSVKHSVIFYFVYLATILPLLHAPKESIGTWMIVVAWLDAALILFFAFRAKYPLRTMLKVNGNVLNVMVAGLVALVPLLAINFGYHHLLLYLFDAKPESLTQPFASESYGQAAVIGYICVMPGIWEEIAFRGLIQSDLQAAIRRREALVLTALMFAIIHLSPLSAPYLFVLGLLLGQVRERSGSLVPGMVIHFAHNLAVTLLETTKGT